MRQANPVFYKKIPLPIKIKRPVLAMGSQTKNTLCFAKGNTAYISPIHPDLGNPRDFLNFEKEVKYCLKKNPKIIAYDLHPEYQSTKYVLSLGARSYELRAIQHHHAHIASCMADNGLKNQRVIGVAFDGTGLGSDNSLWGAEFLLCDYKKFRRAAHLREIPLPGAQRAISEPWRLAAIWLYLIYKEEFLNLGIGLVRNLSKGKWQVLKNMYLKGINSPLSSSMGRFFDAVSSLILAKHKANFEAELPIKLEKLANLYTKHQTPNTKHHTYKYKIIKNRDEYIIDPAPMFKEIIADLKAKRTKEKIAYRFHLTVTQMIVKICLILRRENQINDVVLSGGVFSNSLLLRFSLDLLYKQGFRVFIHKALPCNDGGISLGQAVIAAEGGTPIHPIESGVAAEGGTPTHPIASGVATFRS